MQDQAQPRRSWRGEERKGFRCRAEEKAWAWLSDISRHCNRASSLMDDRDHPHYRVASYHIFSASSACDSPAAWDVSPGIKTIHNFKYPKPFKYSRHLSNSNLSSVESISDIQYTGI